MTKTLKPCPFCGNVPEISKAEGYKSGYDMRKFLCLDEYFRRDLVSMREAIESFKQRERRYGTRKRKKH